MIQRKNIIIVTIITIFLGICMIYHIKLLKKFDPEGLYLQKRMTVVSSGGKAL